MRSTIARLHAFGCCQWACIYIANIAVQDLLNELDSWSQTERSATLDSISNEDKNLIDEIIKEVHIFRSKHLEYARIYIYEQSLTNDSNSNIVGTGGTPFMKYLDKHLQETVPTND